jgi:predicted ArsR family transcriptional regulator
VFSRFVESTMDDIKSSAGVLERKLAEFRRLADEVGENLARAKMLEGYAERQHKNMGFLIAGRSLAEGFRQAIPLFRRLGMEMEVIDISNRGIDAVLEVQRVCPVLAVSEKYGLSRPCHIICEMDLEATQEAFPDMSGEIMCTQADGAPVCVFRYQRPNPITEHDE